MIDRIMTGWTITRAIFLAMGLYVIIDAIVNKQYLGILFGGYFASMGLFALGCAGGNCNTNYDEAPTEMTDDKNLEEITFQEIK